MPSVPRPRLPHLESHTCGMNLAVPAPFGADRHQRALKTMWRRRSTKGRPVHGGAPTNQATGPMISAKSWTRR